MNKLILAAAALAAGLLAGCSSSEPAFGGGSAGTTPAPPVTSGEGPPRVPMTETRAGAQSHQVLDSRVDGVDVSFEVFEPDQIEAGKTYPLVLQGHGYGGARQVTRDGFIARLTAAGYYVISVDERGFGEAGGQVRSMDPEFEGQDLLQMLDWAEDLPGLRRRTDGSMMVGSFGGSYGGMYQMLIAAIDPLHRLRVLAPDITPHDLVFALSPGNVVKSGWGLALAAGGEAPLVTGLAAGVTPSGTNQDPAIFESLIQAVLTNAFSEASRNFFNYHSVRYFCDGLPAGPQEFNVATGDAGSIAPNPYGAIDVLFTQGMRDTLFNLNDAYKNYSCLKARGGDVRLLTHETGHILPVAPPPEVENPLDPFAIALTLPAFQDAGAPSRACGNQDLNDVQFAWFQEKLNNQSGAVAAAMTSGTNVCMSLAQGDAVAMHDVKVGGTPFTLDAGTPQFNSALGVLGATLGNGAREALLATIPLYTAPAEGAVLAGLPTMDLQVASLAGPAMDCAIPLNIGACDPILLLAIGQRHAGMERWDIVDDQITAMRGFGAHQGLMNGIAERLAPGDELALLIYGFHAQFPVTWSRDLTVPATDLSGTISLPIVGPGEIVREGV
ncbi:MAG TPA: CocE/NonD family hydrolase [Solimonas sp.]|nr:CocE/NonD family hydrolase [Solimonas sp.]